MTSMGYRTGSSCPTQSKAKDLAEEQLARVKDEHVRMSLRLQQAFGLRREEALKIQPRWADRGDHLQLKASWTKGGRERTVPIRTQEQRALLEQAKQLAGLGSLIPGGRQYIEQLRIYERHTANAGLSKMHGLRHAYAQQRYLELTGWPSPHAGGPTKSAADSGATADRSAGPPDHQRGVGPCQGTDYRRLPRQIGNADPTPPDPPPRCPDLPGHGPQPL